MENKFNLVEYLKDCPKGMELDCTLFNNVTLNYVSNDGIWINYFDNNGHENEIYLDCEGCLPLYGLKSVTDKCVIFPKGKTTWEGFQRPFKDGEVLITDGGGLCIYKSIHKTYKSNDLIDFYCGYRPADNKLVIKDKRDIHFGPVSEAKLANEEESKKLFDAIKAKGYMWNDKTRTLERLIVPKFEVGDKIKNGEKIATIIRIYKNRYDVKYDSGIGSFTIDLQDEWELADKFDISTLKPFDKVLVRNYTSQKWTAALWSFYNNDEAKYPYNVVGDKNYRCAIPYECNEHLLGDKEDCNEFYKTWEE